MKLAASVLLLYALARWSPASAHAVPTVHVASGVDYTETKE
jgi:hypothetical protein